jgi:4-hydroxy-tetrahydrodipicolinate reductase
MVRIGILGANGRMGRAIAEAVAQAGDASLAGATDRDGPADGAQAAPAGLAQVSDVLVDFTAPDALEAHLDAAVTAGTPILVGTTGLSEAHHQAIAAAARAVAVLQTANTSLGVNVLSALVEQAARLLGEDWDAEIVEMHHRHKLDTPSGTAMLLGASVNIGRGAASPTERNRFDRMQDGPHRREEGGVYYASLRGGSVAGDHMVIFASEGERIELGHRAESRAIFAKGAVRGALWLAGKPAGLYSMKDVLGLSQGSGK